jgi:hypothetical protein
MYKLFTNTYEIRGIWAKNTFTNNYNNFCICLYNQSSNQQNTNRYRYNHGNDSNKFFDFTMVN